jgi:hypothetical protein
MRLNQPVVIPFENETPLSEVVKYIKNATSSGPGDPGIPVWVNPKGLKKQQKVMESTITVNLEGVPLATSLRLMLDQLDLTYFVSKDGLLMIDSEDAPPPRDRVAPLSDKAARTWLKLAQAVDIPFENETPLSDVLKFVRSSTVEGKDSGVPIYVDPAGLQKADRTAESTVTLQIEGVPLGRSLRMMLEQIGLDYYVSEDGLLFITNRDAEVFQDLAAEAEAGSVEDALRDAKKEIEAILKELEELKKARKEKAGEGAKDKLESLRKELDELKKAQEGVKIESLRERLEEFKRAREEQIDKLMKAPRLEPLRLQFPELKAADEVAKPELEPLRLQFPELKKNLGEETKDRQGTP